MSRAERQALDKAEQLRREAEELLQASSLHSVDAARRARAEVSAEVESLRNEMQAVSLRATAAEADLERLRAEHADALLRLGRGEHLSIVEVENPEGGDAERLREEAEAELTLARDEALRILAKARGEAESLLVAVLAAIDRDLAESDAAKEQAVQARQAAERLRGDAEAALAWTHAEAQKALAWAESEAARQVDEARIEAARLVAQAERQGQRILDGAVVVVDPNLAQVRHNFFEEVDMLRVFIDSMRHRLDEIVGLCGPKTLGSLTPEVGSTHGSGPETLPIRGSSVA